jgi:pantothenate kinase
VQTRRQSRDQPNARRVDRGHSAELFDGELSDLANRIVHRSNQHGRFMLGIAGEPGAGKSTVSGYLERALGAHAVVVPFDGFHFANALLDGTELQARKGAIDTFDLAGYRVLVQRLRAADEPVVYAPAYLREVEEPIAASIAIQRATPIVIVEGNYLLADQPDLALARSLLDEVWYVQTADQTRLHRLIQRHIQFGKTYAEARAWALGSDEANAHAIRKTRDQADLIVHLP